MPAPKSDSQPDATPLRPDSLPISAPRSRDRKTPTEGVPDLHIEEIEEKHIPKDRNVFDK